MATSKKTQRKNKAERAKAATKAGQAMLPAGYGGKKLAAMRAAAPKPRGSKADRARKQAIKAGYATAKDRRVEAAVGSSNG